MKINIIDLNKFIEINKCPEVTNPIYFDAGAVPSKDGLLSFELFGLPNSYDRKTIWGYIDLKKPFLHPVTYKALTTLDKRFSKIVSGEKRYIVTPLGELKEDENGGTGIDFIYKNLKKIKFKTSKSKYRKDKLEFINNSKLEELFCDKFLVMPAFYRDFDSKESAKGKQDVGEINPLYSKLLNLTKSIQKESLSDDDGLDFFSLSFMSNITEKKIQDLLVELYLLFTSALAKKTGYIHKAMIGKSIDYSTRSVISAPRYDSSKPTEQLVPFGYTGIPLSQAMVEFLPLVKYHIENIMENLVGSKNYITVIDKKGNQARYTLDNPMDDYTPTEIEKLIELYIKSNANRFDPILVNTVEAGKIPCKFYYNDLQRDFTLIDLLFLATYEAVNDKHVYITRYPIESFQSIYPSKIRILTTVNTVKKSVGGTIYSDYPELKIEAGEKVEAPDKSTAIFYDTVLPSNAMLEALGGDYDGKNICSIACCNLYLIFKNIL